MSIADRPDDIIYSWDDFERAGWRVNAHYDADGAVDHAIPECKPTGCWRSAGRPSSSGSRRLSEAFALPTSTKRWIAFSSIAEAQDLGLETTRAHDWGIVRPILECGWGLAATVEFRGYFPTASRGTPMHKRSTSTIPRSTARRRFAGAR